MARDDESTQQFDIEALRRAQKEASGAPPSASVPARSTSTSAPIAAEDADDPFGDEHTAVDALPYQPTTTSITNDPYQPAMASITRADRPAPPPRSELPPVSDAYDALQSGSYQPAMPSITRTLDRPSPVSAPLPAFDLPSDDPPPSEPLPSFAADEGDANPDPFPSLEIPPSRPGVARDVDDSREETLMVSQEELARLAGTTSEPPPPTAGPSDLPPTATRLNVLELPVLGENAKTDATPAVEMPSDRHPADDADDTRLGRLDVDEVRAAFAAAEAAETPEVPRALDTVRPPSKTEHDDGGHDVSFSSIHDIVTDAEVLDDAEELDEEDLLSDDDEDDDGETAFIRASDPGVEILADVAASRPAPVPATGVPFTAARPSARPPGVAYTPPPDARRGTTPAHLAFADPDEAQLARELAWDALLELYRLRLVDAETPSAKALLFHKIASIHEHALGKPEEAFGPLVQAFDERPMDDDVVASLERVAKGLGRLQELAEHARKALRTTNDHEVRVALLGHLVYWYERLLSRSNDASPFAGELERLDKSHPIVLRRAAQLAAAQGDVKAQREHLFRALERAGRDDEKASLHLQLANSFAGMPEAQKHYEAALSYDPTSIVALQAIERLGREGEKYPQLEWALEQQAASAPTDSERVRALLELAQLHERKFLRRDSAAELFEKVLELEPSQPSALEGLERCYHALRDWARLARVLRMRAAQSYDKQTRAQLLERAAEAYEAKLGDFASAVEVHIDLLAIDAKHKRALTDLARLYEKLGDWPNMATYKARLAEAAPTPKQASVLFAQLAEFLSAPERDPIAARLHYERAVSADPTNLGAWEALQRLAEAAGDERRASQCIEQRAQHAPGPRQRAAALVELGAMQRRLGNERAARQAFESAIDADPANEAAAREVLEPWTREERWAEAAPLCELLVNAAIRDRDSEAHFTRLRLATRIHAALADADRAMAAALAAIDLRPEDPSAQADLVAVASQCRDKKALVAKAKPWLVRIAETDATLPADVLQRVGQLHRDDGDLDAAAVMFERARKLAPDDAALQKELAEVYLALGDFPRACKLKVDLARNATSEDAKFQQLVDAGEIWARQARELPQAALVFEEARQLKPLDHWLLHTLMWVYGELEDWDKLSNVLEGITRIQESPDRRIKSLYAMAQVVRDKVKDSLRAAELFDELLDMDRKRLDVFEELVRTRTEVKDWDGLERSYRKMIARVKDDGDRALGFALFHQLGLIYRDRIGDVERAYEALDAAARLRPEDQGVRKILTELLVVTDNVDNAVVRTRQAIDRNPHDPELYAELYELFLRLRAFDKAWCAVNVLSSMRELTEDERTFLLDYPPCELSQVPGQVVEQAWQSHIFHPDLDRTLTTLFATMTPAVARMRHAQQTQLVNAIGRPFTPAHSLFYEPVRAAFGNGAEILGLRPPELLLGDPGSLVPFAPALSPFGAVYVSPPAVEARADGILYLVGKRLAELRPELTARAFFPSVSDLTSLLSAAVRVSRQEAAKDPQAAQLDASLLAVMTPEERDALRGVVLRAQMEGSRVDVRRWFQAADLSSMRAALLLSGDVEPARRMILGEPLSPADLTPREKLGELYKFAVSDTYADLRGAIGVAIPTDDESGEEG